MRIQASYDLFELARTMGMSTRRARRYLTKLGVKITTPGPRMRATVLLCDMRESMPALFASLEEAAHLQKMAIDDG